MEVIATVFDPIPETPTDVPETLDAVGAEVFPRDRLTTEADALMKLLEEESMDLKVFSAYFNKQEFLSDPDKTKVVEKTWPQFAAGRKEKVVRAAMLYQTCAFAEARFRLLQAQSDNTLKHDGTTVAIGESGTSIQGLTVVVDQVQKFSKTPAFKKKRFKKKGTVEPTEVDTLYSNHFYLDVIKFKVKMEAHVERLHGIADVFLEFLDTWGKSVYYQGDVVAYEELMKDYARFATLQKRAIFERLHVVVGDTLTGDDMVTAMNDLEIAI